MPNGFNTMKEVSALMTQKGRKRIPEIMARRGPLRSIFAWDLDDDDGYLQIPTLAGSTQILLHRSFKISITSFELQR